MEADGECRSQSIDSVYSDEIRRFHPLIKHGPPCFSLNYHRLRPIVYLQIVDTVCVFNLKKTNKKNEKHCKSDADLKLTNKLVFCVFKVSTTSDAASLSSVT